MMKAGAASVGGKIYVFGGVHCEREGSGEYYRTFQVYDPAQDSWTTEKMPWKLYMPSAVVHRGEIWLFSPLMEGEEGGDAVASTWAWKYSPASGQWARYPLAYPKGLNINTPGTIIDGRVYFADFLDGSNRLTKAAFVDLRKASAN
jgi:N-acetylneuraminic acid mutarotase